MITERSPLSSWRVFAELNLGGADMAAFELAYAAVQRMLPERREATAYLRLDAATTLQRVARRGRSEEGKLDGDFACAVTEQHEAMVGAIPHRKHYIDAAGSPAEVAAAVLAVAESMLQPHAPGDAAAGSAVDTSHERDTHLGTLPVEVLDALHMGDDYSYDGVQFVTCSHCDGVIRHMDGDSNN